MKGDKTLGRDEPRMKVRGGFSRTATVPTRTVEHDDRVGSLRVVATPGHTPGHVAFIDTRDGTGYVGDLFTTRNGMAASAATSWRYPIAGLATWNRELSLPSAQLLHELRPERLAAARGYRATGLDSDPAMIAQAARLARRQRSSASFTVATLDHAAGTAGQADVVVAASLLAVVPDPVAALRQLWSCVSPMGTQLVLETSQRMTPANARRLLATGLDGPGRPFLTLWAHARNGRAIPPRLFDSLRPATPRHHPLLGGLAVATTIAKPAF